MIGINRVILVGTLAQTPQTKTTAQGKIVCDIRLRIVIDRKDGQQEVVVEAATWGDMAARCQRLAAGQAVCIDGIVKGHEYTDRNGQQRYAMNILAYSVQILGSAEPPKATEDCPF